MLYRTRLKRYEVWKYHGLFLWIVFGLSILSEYNTNPKLINFDFYPQVDIFNISFIHLQIAKSPRNLINHYYEANYTEIEKYLCDDGKIPHMSGVFFIPSALNHTNATYVDMEYVYACPYGGCANLDGRIFYPDKSNSIPRFGESGKVIKYLENVVSLGSKWSIMYGHWVCDVLAPIMFMPEEVINKSVFLLPVNSTIYAEAISLLGFNEILFLKSNQWVFARHFHSVYNPEPVHGCIHYGLKALSNKIKGKLNASNVIPTNFGLYNRPMGNRHFFNFEEFIEICHLRFPDIKFYILETLYPTFRESVFAYASCKMYFGPTGSNFANLVWMSSKTVCVVGMGSMHDDPVIANALVMNIWMVTFLVPGMYHHGSFTGTIDFPLAIKAMNKGFFVLENQRWPNSHEVLEY